MASPRKFSRRRLRLVGPPDVLINHSRTAPVRVAFVKLEVASKQRNKGFPNEVVRPDIIVGYGERGHRRWMGVILAADPKRETSR